VVYCGLLRAAHKWKKAVEEVVEVERRLNALDPELTIGQMFETRHYRSALALHEQGEAVPPELAKKAREYFQRLYANGYTALEKWAQPAPV
jgi:hypothetical protein